jgi:putative nucleotidyltransferase with HDIG domain
MLFATTVVAVLPLAVSLALRASGAVSAWVSVALAVGLSLGASSAGSLYWRKRGGHGEVLFSELLLWGWIRRWRQERELANATRLLDLVNSDRAPLEGSDELSVERREHLLRQLAGALEGQDIYLNGHSRRVARHATMIARGMGLSNEDVARIRAAAAVHDVGKLRTPKAVLNKPGRLSDEEFEAIKRHPVDGAEMVAALGDAELTRIVRHHHERLDGAGYPNGLRGEDIPLGARIISVADTFDAITSARPYRAAAPHQKAIDILRHEAGAQLDPDAVRAFLAYYSGSRPTMVWAIITASVRRVIAWLSGDPAAAATLSAGKVAATTAATAAIGAAAAAAPVPVMHHAPPPRVSVHALRVTPRAASTLTRRGVVVSVPAAPGAVPTPAARRTAAKSSSPRPAHPSGRQTAKVRAAKRGATRKPGAGTGAPASAGSPAHAPRASARISQSSAQSAPASAQTGAVNSSPAASHSQGTSASHSQGGNANGNAYGHHKPLGNGHGNGVAAGHATPPPATHPTPATHRTPATHPTPAPSQASHGNAGAHANPQTDAPASPPASAHANLPPAPAVSAPPAAPPAAVPTSAPAGGHEGSHDASQNGQGNDNSQGNGNGNSQAGDSASATQAPPAAATPSPSPSGHNG